MSDSGAVARVTTGSCDVVVAFCLYHCPCPEEVIAQIARCLPRGSP